MSSLLAQAKSFDFTNTALFRILALVAGLISNIIIIAILTRQHGASSYAGYALVASLTNLLPFADLGLGASVINATADRNGGALSQALFSRHLSRARDILSFVALLLLAVDAIITFSGFWPRLLGTLGTQDGIPAAATYTLGCIAIAIPLGLGSRLLQGMGRMVDVVRIGLLGPVIQIALAVPLFLTHASAGTFAWVPGTAYLAIAIAGFVVGLRRAHPDLLRPMTSLGQRLRGQPRLADTAVPFLIISLGMALGFQSHRLLLSQFGGESDVATYSIVAQFTGPVLAIITVVGQNLWTRYRQASNADRVLVRDFRSHVVIFAGVGLFSGMFMILLIPLAARLVSGGAVAAPLAVVAAAAFYVTVTSIHQPSAMFLNDTRGLWFQAAVVVLVAVGTIGSIVLLAPSIGAASAYLGTATFMLFVQVIPSLVVAFKRLVKPTESEEIK